MFSSQVKNLERTQELLSGYLYAPNSEQEKKSAGHEEELSFIRNISPILTYAALGGRQLRVILWRIVFELVAIVVVALLTTEFLMLALIPAALFFEYYFIRLRAYRRSESFEKDYTALLLSLASGVRTGLDPLVALSQSELLFMEKSEVRTELKKLNDNIGRGLPEERVIAAFGDTLDHPDIQLFRTAFILARKEGAGLAECLQRLARVTRQRQSFRRKVKSAVAMQKLSALGIAGCAIGIGLVQFVANPKAVHEALAHPFGFKLLVIGLTLIIIGVIWMMRLTRSRI